MGGRGGRSGNQARGRGTSGSIGTGGTGAAPSAAPSGTPQAQASNGFAGVVNGTDLTNSGTLPSSVYTRSPQAIADAMDAQGFRGKPKVITDQAEFDKAVQAAWGGKGLEVVRGVGAPDDATLSDYRDSLTDGEWYVSCGGGAAHGYGQYGVYRYGGKVSSGDVGTAQAYGRYSGRSTHVFHYTLDPSAKIGEESKIASEMASHNAQAIKNSGALAAVNNALSGRKRVTNAEQAAVRSVSQGLLGKRGASAQDAKSYNKIIDIATAALKSSGQTVFGDVGVFAAAKGYDFYYDRWTGYSVALNRTKLIVLKDW